MICKHVASHDILRGSSIHLQLDMSCLFSRDCKPRARGQRPANMILLSILDGVLRAGFVLKVVKVPAMKSSSWDGDGQRGRVKARRAGFITILLVAQG